MWPHNSNRSTHFEQVDYVAAMRLRLGDAGPAEPQLCANCQNHYVNRGCEHALNCARGPCNRGHDAVRDVLFSEIQRIDGTALKSAAGSDDERIRRSGGSV